MTWTQRFGFVRLLAFATLSSNSPTAISESVCLAAIDCRASTSTMMTPTWAIRSCWERPPISQMPECFKTNLKVRRIYCGHLGRHTLAFGFQYDHTQLNIINQNNQQAVLGFSDFYQFRTGKLVHTGQRMHFRDYGSVERRNQPLLPVEPGRHLCPGQHSLEIQPHGESRVALGLGRSVV